MFAYIQKHVCVPPVPQTPNKGERLQAAYLLAVPPFPLFPTFVGSCEVGHSYLLLVELIQHRLRRPGLLGR